MNTQPPAASITRPLQAPLALGPLATALQPENFQARLIDSMSAALRVRERTQRPPCLLRAPTGSGKTFMLGQVLQRVGEDQDVLWLWFVPFVTLVAQTLDALLHSAAGLHPVPLAQGRNQEVGAGTVLISTVQAVARAQWRRQGWDADGDDDVRTLAALLARARAQGLAIGLVVDEAHIALDRTTEFGQFAHWLQADYLLMATATPKDQRLTDFVVHAGYGAQQHFSVGRDDVVRAKLNKQYIEAVVYSLGGSMASVTDVRRTVLRQAWARSQAIARELAQRQIACTPLLLVQVANGAGTVEEAARELMQHCAVPPEAIGQHSADAPDPVLMAAIANDTRKQVLIFKQSAGTGFDAPRAFVLASTKSVNDADFALQFMGRVMRVDRTVRAAFAGQEGITPELNTAYVYLANAEAQAGYEAAVQATSSVKTQLEGQTEKLMQRRTVNGAVVYTNQPSDQPPLTYSFGLPTTDKDGRALATGHAVQDNGPQAPLFAHTAPAQSGELPPDLWGGLPLDVLLPVAGTASRRNQAPRTLDEVRQTLAQHRLRLFERKRGSAVPTLGDSLKAEEKPGFVALSAISRQVAQELPLPESLQRHALQAALNRMTQKELHRELTTGTAYAQDIAVVTDRRALAREALAALQQLPHAEEEDYRLIVQVLTERLRPALATALAELGEGSPAAAQAASQLTDAERLWLLRDAAHWVLRVSAQELREAIFAAIATQARLVDAQPLPDAMLCPEEVLLEPSAKNIYGVLPPCTEDWPDVEGLLFMDARQWWKDQTLTLEDGPSLRLARYDGAVQINSLERDFARALDSAEFVLWWHRNPDKKPWAVRVVRAEHSHYFYPDFVVCVVHAPGAAPMQRLLETKQDTKDAARKAQRWPAVYGRVLFLTPDGQRLRWVQDDGSLGDTVKLPDMQGVYEQLASTAPVQ
ncbi:Superfamily II DNA or RNA helicase [Oryzisolibacter propanilivorax]|uniref:Superfamily II DNA or RNA helicase n=1 Tax=Oryzisolibacter propanilivorax TaxID=1527607 RepID=A0A1G9RRZ0_9BURK|nr:DEAD/DEAH box helicase family protein [Oryzisolibacter propanilivorax]SDM25912.1 Superfamily II DNA or RNA helicase [Oryzisolibacter propanilivorax]